MYKLAIVISLLIISAVSLAADSFLGWNSNDVAKMKSAIGNEKLPPWHRLSYATRLAQIEDPASVDTYDKLVKLLEAAAGKYNLDQRHVETAKMQQPFCKRIFIWEGFAASGDSDYAVYYLGAQDTASKLGLSAKEIYTRLYTYLIKDKSKATVSQIRNTVPYAVKAMIRLDFCIGDTVARRDYQALKKMYSAYAAKDEKSKELWAPTLKLIDDRLAQPVK